MAVVQFAVFEEFRGQTTLLVLSNGAGIAELAIQFRGMADGRVSTVEFGKLPWAHSGQSIEVTLRVVTPGCEGENLSRSGDKWLVEWRGLATKFSEAANLVEALVPEQYAAGHQYLDTRTFQFMVSKGEYPPDLKKLASQNATKEHRSTVARIDPGFTRATGANRTQRRRAKGKSRKATRGT